MASDVSSNRSGTQSLALLIIAEGESWPIVGLDLAQSGVLLLELKDLGLEVPAQANMLKSHLP